MTEEQTEVFLSEEDLQEAIVDGFIFLNEKADGALMLTDSGSKKLDEMMEEVAKYTKETADEEDVEDLDGKTMLEHFQESFGDPALVFAYFYPNRHNLREFAKFMMEENDGTHPIN